MRLCTWLAALLLAVTPAKYSKTLGPPVAHRHWIGMRLVPVTTKPSLGDSLVFRLEFLNRGSSRVGLWNPPPYHPDGWDLTVLIRRPSRGGQRILRQAVGYQALYAFADSDLVVLEPNDQLEAWLTFGTTQGPERGRWYGGWEVFTPAEYSRYRREHVYRVDSDVMGKCFDRPGIYRIEARLVLAGAGMAMWKPDLGWPREPAMCEDTLRAVANLRIEPRAK